MQTVSTDSPLPGPGFHIRRSPSRWLGIGLALLMSAVALVGLTALRRPPVPHFPNATLHVAGPDGHVFAWAGLQDSQGSHELIPGRLTLSMQPKGYKYLDKKSGTRFQTEWRPLRSSASADTYEFRYTTGANALPTVKTVQVSNEPVELLRVDDVVVTIQEIPVAPDN